MNIEDQKQKVNQYCNNIFNNRSAIEEAHMKEVFGSSLTLNEVHILELLETKVFESMTELAESLHITPGTLSTSIKRLTSKGHVQRIQDPADKRIYSIELTSQGKEAVQVHRKLHDKLIVSIWRDLDIENDKLIEVLEALDRFFKEQLLLERNE